MATENRIDFKVRVTDEGLAPLANSLDKVDRKVDDLGASAGVTGRQIDGLGTEAAGAGQQMDGMGGTAQKLAGRMTQVAQAVVGAFAVDRVIQFGQSVSQVADNYNNLAGRIQLVTGAGEAFEKSFERVKQIALDTNSSLEGTGDLFARLTESGKSAGLSTQEAIADALALTETINQAVQVSGAGAQASDAALRQLIQGLQGGALRGDEFNSVMEQSPRLAKALADGLGVTTGQLRAMANEGRLTSDVVIQSLKSQADTLKAEFDTLPPTVGRAVQNLSTAWTVYVGEADKATGASKTAAQAINVLAENLDTVAGYLLDAGQAAAAFTALRLAQTFLGIGAAAKTSATAIAANTAAMTAANAASAGAAAGVGRFAAILGSLKTFTLLGILTNIQDIGTWIGESAAKLAGYKDRTDELAQADRARAQVADENRRIAEAQAAANKLAAETQFELTSAARSSLAVFDELTLAGKSAAEAVAEVGKDFDLASLPGIVNASAVLDKLAADGKIGADQFRQAWSDALKGEDLAAFEVRARAALDGTAREAERLAAIMDASLREAIRRSGADFDVLSGGMSKAARSAINDTDLIVKNLDKLKAQGVDVGKALEASLAKGIKTADSQAAITALRERVEQLRKTLGDKVADGLLAQLEEQAKKATGALGGLGDALKQLGITSDAELKKAATDARALYDQVVKTGGSAREQAQAFEKMATAAIASGDSASLAFAKSQAAARGFEITSDAAGKTVVRAMAEAAAATEGAGETIERSMDGSKEAVGRFSKGVADAAAQLQRLKELQGFAGAGGDLSGVSTEDLKKAQADLLKEGGALSSPEYIKLRNELMGRGAPKTDANGFTLDKSGNTLAMGGELNTLTGIANFLKQAGLDDAQARNLAREFADGKGEIPYFNNPGQIKYGGRESTISEALLKAAERITFGLGNSGASAVGGQTGDGGRILESSSSRHVVEFKNAGRSRSFNAASAADASTAAAILREIGTAQARSK